MVDVEELLEKGYILCRTIIEIVGGPKEYVDKTLKEYVEHIKKDQSVKIVETDFAEAEERDDKLFSAFVEMEIMVKNFQALTAFCIGYMPSSVEILEPEDLKFKANELSGLFNDLQGKLHHFDMAIKQLNAKNKLLERNATLLLRNNIMIKLKDKELDIKELSKGTGIPEDQLNPFVEKLVSDKFVEKKGNKYMLKK